MTFKEFAYGAFVLPGRLVSGVVGLIFGSYDRDERGRIEKDQHGNKETRPGLISFVVDLVQFGFDSLFEITNLIVRGISDLFYDYQDAIALTFWTSVIVGGAAALTVGLWPAALAAVTSFSIYGVSIASLVGSGFAIQVAAVAGLAAAVTNAVLFATTVLVGTVNALMNLFSGKSNDNNVSNHQLSPDDHGSVRRMNELGLGASSPHKETSPQPPFHTGSDVFERSRSPSPSLTTPTTTPVEGDAPAPK